VAVSAYVIDAPTLSRVEIDLLIVKERQRSAARGGMALNQKVSAGMTRAMLSVAGVVWLLDAVLLLQRMR
jgi:hypothetical protein